MGGSKLYPPKATSRFFARPRPARRTAPIKLADNHVVRAGTPLIIGYDGLARPMHYLHAVYRIKFTAVLPKGATQTVLGCTMTAATALTAVEVAELWSERKDSVKATFVNRVLADGGRIVQDKQDLNEVLYATIVEGNPVPTVIGGAATVAVEGQTGRPHATRGLWHAHGILCMDSIATPLSGGNLWDSSMFIAGSFWEDGLTWFAEAGETLTNSSGEEVLVTPFTSGAVTQHSRFRALLGTDIDIEQYTEGEV